MRKVILDLTAFSYCDLLVSCISCCFMAFWWDSVVPSLLSSLSPLFSTFCDRIVEMGEETWRKQTDDEGAAVKGDKKKEREKSHLALTVPWLEVDHLDLLLSLVSRNGRVV